MRRPFDALEVDIWCQLLAAVAEEMGAALQRTAYSPNIKDRLDHSCALFDRHGSLLSQAAHIPVHLGAMPLMMERLLPAVVWKPGEMWLCNDPRFGGTHLPDLTLVAPVFLQGARNPAAFVASRAHHADVGGATPGSLAGAVEAFQEGIVIPPVRLVSGGAMDVSLARLVAANSRTPDERIGDLAAQVAANETGIRRTVALLETYGASEFRRRAQETMTYSAGIIRRRLAGLPAGSYQAEDFLESDGVEPVKVRIRVTATILPSGFAAFDFEGTAAQTAGGMNATEAVTRSACYYVVRCLGPADLPTNAGCFQPVRVAAPEGSVVNARFPAAVAAGNVETSQRIVDVVMAALRRAAPEQVPAQGQGTMNNLTVGGWDPERRRAYSFYETLGGGAGASSTGDGASAVHTHMTNTRNTSVEAMESHYPLRVVQYSVAEGTGGDGFHRGGDGLVRSIQLLSQAHIGLLTERRSMRPLGAEHGEPGARGINSLQLPGRLGPETLRSAWSGECPAGSVLTLQTPGGGGWGRRNAVDEKSAS